MVKGGCSRGSGNVRAATEDGCKAVGGGKRVCTEPADDTEEDSRLDPDMV